MAMAIAGDLSVFATLSSHRSHPIRTSTHSSSKLEYSGMLSGGLSISEITRRKPNNFPTTLSMQCQSNSRLTIGVTESTNHEAEAFLLNAINMNFLDRLNLAWKIIFPSLKTRRSSNANIAKQRLKMILFSDRCDVSDEAKRKIVKSVVSALSDFVEIESQEKVQLSVSTDSDIGTVYSVTVPVRRVKAEYMEVDEAEYIDNGDSSGSVYVS